MMDLEFILKLITIGLVHWALVGIALKSLIERKRVLGGRKGLWAVPILLVSCFGPLSYLIVHELVPEPQREVEWDGWR